MQKYLFVASSLLFIAMSIFMLFDILPKAEEVNDMFKVSVPDTIKTLLQYYSVRMMNLFLYTQVAFIATITAITFFMLEKNSSATVRGGEIIPMLSSGFSRKRVSIPFFIVGCFCVFVLCGVEEFFYANCREWPGVNSDSYTGVIATQEMTQRTDELTELQINGTNLDLETMSFNQPCIMVPRNRTQMQIDRIYADKARWLPENTEHPAGYMLENVKKLSDKTWLVQAAQVEVEISSFGRKSPIFYTSETAEWVLPGNLFILATITPENLARNQMKFLPPSILELYHLVRESNGKKSNIEERFEFHARILRPFTESLLLFVMIPVILSARLRSKPIIFLCLATLTGFQVALVEIGRLLVIQGEIPASIGAWLPIIVLAGVSAVLFNELYT